MTSYNGQSVTYDTIGNPLSYLGATLTWTQGRRLKTAQKNGVTSSYQYDGDGLRTSKTVSSTTTEYFWFDGQLASQYTGSDKMVFWYDASGEIIGFRYNNAVYTYAKNLQGDVIGIVDQSYNVVATYQYDSWGKLLSIKNASGGDVTNTTNHIGYLNPIRYRGYYYDQETGWYYLQSRYYNPETGRFLNADGYIGTGEDELLGNNLYAYCFNNPVSWSDSTGNWPNWGKLFSAANLLTIGITAMVVAGTVLSCGTAAPAMMVVAAVTFTAGAVTTGIGLAEAGESITGYNIVRDYIFGGDQKTYDTVKNVSSTIAKTRNYIMRSLYGYQFYLFYCRDKYFNGRWSSSY